MPYQVRPMRPEDAPQVSAIEREAFPTQGPTTSFERELKNRMAYYLVACETDDLPPTSDEGSGYRDARAETPSSQVVQEPTGSQPADQRLLARVLMGVKHLWSNGQTSLKVVVSTQKIVGYVGFWLIVHEAHITAIATSRDYRQRGIGELLLMSSIDLATELGAQFVTLEVRMSNLAAQALYEKYGFIKTGLRKGYYTDNREDAYIMTTDKIPSASYQTALASLKREYQRHWGTDAER